MRQMGVAGQLAGRSWLTTRAGRYAPAVLLVAIAALCRYFFAAILEGTPYLAFYPAVAVAAALGGFGPGMVASISGTLAVDLFFVPPAWGFNLNEPVELARIAIFVGGGGAVSVIGGVLRRTRLRNRSRPCVFRRTSPNSAGPTRASASARAAFGRSSRKRPSALWKSTSRTASSR